MRHREDDVAERDERGTVPGEALEEELAEDPAPVTRPALCERRVAGPGEQGGSITPDRDGRSEIGGRHVWKSRSTKRLLVNGGLDRLYLRERRRKLRRRRQRTRAPPALPAIRDRRTPARPLLRPVDPAALEHAARDPEPATPLARPPPPLRHPRPPRRHNEPEHAQRRAALHVVARSLSITHPGTLGEAPARAYRGGPRRPVAVGGGGTGVGAP